MSTTSESKKKKGTKNVFIHTLIILALLLGGVVALSAFWTELQWFGQLKAGSVFWTQYLAQIGFALIGMLACAAAVAVSLRIGLGRNTGGETQYPAEPGEKNRRLRLEILRKKWLSLFVVPLVAGIFFGVRFGSYWQEILLWLHRTDFGRKDPEFGKDISFYVFSLPVIQTVISAVFVLLTLALVAGLAGYGVSGRLGFEGNRLKMDRSAQLFVGIVCGLAALTVAADFWIARYNLLLGNNARFSGASFTDINASKPGLTIFAVSVFLIAGLFVFAGLKRNWKPAFVGIAATVASGLVLTGLYPFLVQNFKVDPNAAELESEYIQRNINATLAAYGLDKVESRQYKARTDAKSGQLRQDSATAAQIRLLDPSVVSPSFNQLQQNRQYYKFSDRLAVDRYKIGDEMRDTVIAMRELNLAGLDNSRRSWVNDHTVYTHGFGVAAAFGNTVTTKGDPSFWEAGIPSTGEMGKYESRIYFGQNSPEYSIVGAPRGTEKWELDYPDDTSPNGQVNTTYKGNGGPKISNIFAKLMFAIKFRSSELFFSDRVTDKSQILYDRDPHVRIAKVAPYLTLDSKAVPAVVDMDGDPSTPKELVWIVDGYTTSNNYPYSARETLETATRDSLNRNGSVVNAPDQVNYIRNSVKAVVNAYDGSVKLFQWDKKDPIINAWKKIFPGQIIGLDRMSGDLIAHMRYPEDLFKVQRTLMARYHVKDAKSFYSGGDFWQVPREPTMKASAGTPAQPPYYLTLQMPGQKQASFSISTSYIPGGNTNRNVMTGFLAADSNAGNEPGKIAESYGKLRLIETPRDLTVPGPGQAENTMLTNPDVSTALNLLRQGGTQVREGNLLSLPVGGGLLYVQPIYVQAASGTQYPTLQYVLALFGDQVGFAPTLDEALDEVFGGNSGAKAGDAKIAGNKKAQVPGNAKNGKKNSSPAGADKSADKGKAEKDAAPNPQKASLDAALHEAGQALLESENARRSGDWAAYGKAQEKLAKAIKDATAARQSTAGEDSAKK
ncbi:UPF0182 family protein [Arcanobacterium sp. S3PF19]|uniref:UPF0182 family membrane protein n=1 Tax=Arcanobacterium sp. S3PF19 TaxID=1219585 RepID=UPI00068D78B0|nr:UPF0182 family protein [Arcanobacterium sp. S3PF19]